MPVPYSRSAALYDRIYGDKSFAAEAETLRELVTAEHPSARTLLDVACGTGAHLQHLREHFEITGLDGSPDMLGVARQRLGDVALHEGDLRRFDLDGRRFDVITCLFSAIGYVRSLDELDEAIATMTRHLADDGMLLVEPWFTPAQWRPTGMTGGMAVDAVDLKVARFCVSAVRDRFAITPMHHLVATPEGVEHFVETHELFLAERDEVERAFARAGLADIRYLPEKLVRGLWLGRRRK
ncbi:MAG TPA: methyltransferase domain-containing protein [Nannocystaceae bacterium]|nr:methyltransferase domain-containing protein [Nannocystaceae bacterium]